MNRIYISRETNPYYNVAAEYQLLLNTTNDTSLFLWQNSPSVIFGRNQNIFAEVDTDYLKENNISPLRRFSGGGAVFQDLGNLNFTFLTKENNAEIDKYLLVIKNAVSSFNINCEFSGRNDLITNKKKFSGHAYYTNDDNYLYHGTIMVDVNLDMLSKALKPSFIKLESKGIDSIRSRVVNLSSINNSISIEKMKKALIKSFEDVFSEVERPTYIGLDNYNAPRFNEIKSDKWIYGESPNFSITVEKKLNYGNLSIYCDINDGIIQNIKIQSDSLLVIDFSNCEKSLIGENFKEDIIFDLIERYIRDNYK